MACEWSVTLGHNNKGDSNDDYKHVSRKNEGRASGIRQKNRKAGSSFEAMGSLSFLFFLECLIPFSVFHRLRDKVQTEAKVPSVLKLGGSMGIFTLQISGREKQKPRQGQKASKGPVTGGMCGCVCNQWIPRASPPRLRKWQALSKGLSLLLIATLQLPSNLVVSNY